MKRKPRGSHSRLRALLPGLILFVLACASPSLVFAQWGPISDDTDQAPAEPWIMPEDEDEPSSRRARKERTPRSDAPTLSPQLSASFFGGYLGLASAEGRGRNRTFGHGLRAGIELYSMFPLEIAYLGARQKGGNSAITSVSRYHTLLVLPGWQIADAGSAYGISAGLSATYNKVSHQWIDGGELEAARADLGPAISFAMKMRTAGMEVRLDAAALFRGSKVDLLIGLGLGYAQASLSP